MTKRTGGQKQSTVRIGNRRLVLDLLRDSQEMTVAQLSDKIKLSKTTIWKIIDHFLDKGLVVLCGKGDASEEGGKKPELYRFNENFGYVISIGQFEDALHLALTDARGTVFYKEVVHTRPNAPLEDIITFMVDFINKWQEPTSFPNGRGLLLGIVMAASGVVDSEQGKSITASRFNSWRVQSPIKDLVMEQVELKAPFYMDNYNRFYVYAEKVIGQVKDKANIITISVNQDGVGAGIIADNNIKRGPRFLTGEVGHMTLNPFDDEVCHCGGKGCFEQQVSHDRLLNRARLELPDHPDSLLNNGELTPQRIFDASAEGDLFARHLMDTIIDWFVMALYNINMVFNFQTFIIAGDYRNAGEYFLTQLRERVEKHGFQRMDKSFDIRYSVFDEEGVIRGGACFAIKNFFEKRMDY